MCSNAYKMYNNHVVYVEFHAGKFMIIEDDHLMFH